MSDYILADDLSGALEAGASFRARGWRVTLPLDAAAVGHRRRGELQVVSTETRGASPERAAESVRQVIASHKIAGSRLLFKKIDSTLRGPIGVELAAVIAGLEPPLVVVCPANPAAGRIVRGGELFVHGSPLVETEFRNDPQWPARSSRVRDVLASQGLQSTKGIPVEAVRDGRAAAAFKSAIASGHRLLIADAETGNDLRLIAASARAVEPGALLVGSGALAAAVAEDLPGGGQPLPDASWDECRPVLILCGSAHPRSHEQLAHLVENGKVPVLPFVAGLTDGSDAAGRVADSLSSRGVAAVRFSSPRSVTADSARQLQESIGKWTRSLLESVPLDGFVVTGGETAWTVCRAVGGTELEVIREFEPGVVLSRLFLEGIRTLLLVTKPGGFGSKAILSSVLPAAVK